MQKTQSSWLSQLWTGLPLSRGLQAKHGYRLLRISIFKRCFVTCDCAAFWALTLALALPLVHAPAVLYCQMMSICMYQIKTCFLTTFCKAPFGANTNNESHPDVLLRAVYNCPWANTGYSMNIPTFSRVWPCDLCIETQYAGTIGNCTRQNENGRPEHSQETGMLHRGRGITLPFCVPVSNFTKIKFLCMSVTLHSVPLHTPPCTS